MLLEPGAVELEAAGKSIKGATLWAGADGDELAVCFMDGTVVSVTYSTIANIYDVYVNDVFTYACHFRPPMMHGVIFRILKDGRRIRIAETPYSTCEPANVATESKGSVVSRNLGVEEPLRITLLKGNAEKSLKRRRVQFLI